MKRNRQTRKAARANSVIPQTRIILLAFLCLGIVVTIFFFGAGQHFSSYDYGIKNSRLRRQLEDLENEKRKLLLAREVALTPDELSRTARRIGISSGAVDNATLAAVRPSQGESMSGNAIPASASASDAGQYVIERAVMTRPVSSAVSQKLIEKTVRSQPVKVAPAQRPEDKLRGKKG